MKLIIKDLKQKQYDVEVDSDDITVKDLKMAMEKKYEFDSESLKLLHNGVILEDDKKLQEYSIKDQNVLIVMNTRKKSKNPPPPPDNIEEDPNAPKYPNYDPQIEALTKKGYPKPKVEKAVFAARGGMELAEEYLNRAGIYPPGEEAPGAHLPEEVKKYCGIMKVVCQRNPPKLLTILDNIKIHNPELLAKIKENEEDFKELLEAPVSLDDEDYFKEFQTKLRQTAQMGGPGLGGLGGGLGGMGGRRPGQVEIRLTKEEADAIKRLKELTNCSQAEVIQAFLACDKNEELAANYLFELKMNEDNNNPGQGP